MAENVIHSNEGHNLLPESNGYFNLIYNLFINYKNYLFLIIGILIVLYIIYYLFFKKTPPANVSKPILAFPNKNPVNDKGSKNSKPHLENIKKSKNNVEYISSESPKENDSFRKLKHPNYKINELNETNDSANEDNDSFDINNELARLNAEENMNISCHNLTNSELEDINNKLNMIQNNKK
jgi:hypothetical protein